MNYNLLFLMNFLTRFTHKKGKIILLIFLLTFGYYIRIYNIDSESFWFDEILSYWITDPNISIYESFSRHNSIEQIPFFYHLILKTNFIFFSYDSFYGRILSVIFNLLGIFFIVLTVKNIAKNNSYLLAAFLLVSNIFLIKYSQEMRPYSFIFLLSSVNIYLFYKIINLKNLQKIDYLKLFLFVIFQILMIMSHPFTLIIFFSFGFFIFLNFLNKRKNKTLLRSFQIVFIFSVIYILFFFTNLESYPSWITQPDLKFYTNFYFSKFFGSRALGIFHLFSLLILSVIYFRNILKKNEIYNLLFSVIFLSYFLPLLYGYIFKPILFPRYIIFVLIPITILLAILTYEIKTKILRLSVIFLFIFLNLGNHFTEETFKQFYKGKTLYKPDYQKMLKVIDLSESQNYILDFNFNSERKKNEFSAINHYIENLNINKKRISLLNYQDFIKSNEKKAWLICLTNFGKDECKKFLVNQKDKVVYDEKLNGIHMIMISNLNQ